METVAVAETFPLREGINGAGSYGLGSKRYYSERRYSKTLSGCAGSAISPM